MSQHIDRKSGKVSWRIRIIHKAKRQSRKECLLCTIRPEDFKGSRRVKRKA